MSTPISARSPPWPPTRAGSIGSALYPRGAPWRPLRGSRRIGSRDLNPCLFDHGRLYVAPADSPRVYAFDAATGQILWPGRRSERATGNPVQDPLDDVVHLLGVRGDCLIASGYRLYWINLNGPRAGKSPTSGPKAPIGSDTAAG